MRKFTAPATPRLWTLAALAAGLATGAASAQGAPRSRAPANDWAIHRWTTANGLPQNSVTDAVQDGGGMLWLSTFGGLVRFDGNTMKVLAVADDPQLGTNRLLCVCARENGDLLIGTEDHGLLRFDGRHLQPVRGGTEAPTLTVLHGAPAPNGDLWLATNRGVARLRGSQVELPWPDVPVPMNAVASADDGTIYAAANNGCWAFGSGAPRHWAGPPVNSVVIADDGTALLGGPDGIRRIAGDRLEPFCDTATSRVGTLAITTDHRLAIAGDRHFECWQIAPPVRLQRRELPAPGRSILEDREGRIWVGTDGAGLMSFQRADLRTTGTGRTTLVLGDGGGGWYRAVDRHLSHVDETGSQRDILELDVGMQTLSRTPSGSLLLAAECEVRRLEGTTAIATGWTIDRSPHGRITALDATLANTVWFGTEFGSVGCWRDGERHVWRPDGLARGAAHCILNSGGITWVGTAHGVLRSADGGETWSALRAGKDLAAGEVRGIAADDRGWVWVGSYGGGLTCLRPEGTRILTRMHGLPSNDICQLEIDRERGELLANTNTGVFCCLLADLQAVVTDRAPAVASHLLESPDGTSIEGNGFLWPSSCRLADGTWLFCTLNDVVRLPPGHGTAASQPLLAHIEPRPLGTDAGGQPSRHVRLQFTAPAFENASFLTFRHRLRGRDDDWVLDGQRRFAEYYDLAGGDYVFEVAATGPGTAWGPTASIAFRVPPRWYERLPVWIAIAIAAVGVVLAIARAASARQASNNRLLRAAVRARTEELETENARRRDAERSLQSAHDDLERRVAARTAELSTALRQIELDVEERSGLQRQVDQLQRLESIGRLAGGIAHDFNNLLTVVRSSAELIRADPHGTTHDDLLVSIERAAMQGTRLTQQLLTFARRQAVRPEVFDLRDLVRSSTQMLRRLVSANIDLTVTMPDAAVIVEADRAQIEQVLVNLCVNARDAMANGGKLTVEIDHCTDDQVRPMCTLRVVDTGIGMTKEVAEHACEPFFSTKNRSTNSGLGLSTCFGIVKRLGGDLRIDSVPGVGTAIAITLPCSDKALPPVEIEIPRPPQLTGTALVVEDHPEVRAVLTRLLEQLGCRVDSADDGEGALRTLRRGDPFDFMVSDVSMPGIHGVELVAAVRALRPQLPIVFVSGNPEPDGQYGRLRAMGFELLDKPPDPARLAAAIHRARSQAHEGTPATSGPTPQ